MVLLTSADDDKSNIQTISFILFSLHLSPSLGIEFCEWEKEGRETDYDNIVTLKIKYTMFRLVNGFKIQHKSRSTISKINEKYSVQYTHQWDVANIMIAPILFWMGSKEIVCVCALPSTRNIQNNFVASRHVFVLFAQ